ncbi:MAG: hypothetical protein HQM10_09535 [Candidatus Riflebacteria bacterium]|nr:hypothetical protein [Candidatus Riflebacteria bacterium]
MICKIKKHLFLFCKILLGLTIFLGIILVYFIHSAFVVPTSRLGMDRYYPEMPPDEKHHYLTLPIDHNDKSRGQFKGFYILSPNFRIGDEVIFFLTDGQMELVDTEPYFPLFENLLPELSYVLIFVRGQSPTLFPEVYRKDGGINYKEALNLYGSDQQIEDIEAVRADMLKKGMIHSDGKIMLLGASGAGVLAQQYISKYGRNVSKAILEVTGAPDLSTLNKISYSRDLENYDSSVFREYEQVVEKKRANSAELSYLLYNLARISIDGPAKQLQMLQDLNAGKSMDYWKFWFNPQCNLMICKNLLSLPTGVAAKVRWWELVGGELRRYSKAGRKPINLLYEFSLEVLAEFISGGDSGEIESKCFRIERASYEGEILIISGNEDVVFSPEIGRILSKEYKNSKLASIKDGHRMLVSKEYLKQLRKTFFLGGFRSGDFLNAYRNEKQLNKE